MKYYRIIAVGLGIAVVILGIGSVYFDEIDRKETLETIAKYGTKINWKDTQPFLFINSYPKHLEGKTFQCVFKIFPTKLSKVSQPKIDQIKKSATQDHARQFKYISEANSEYIFNIFAESDGSIVMKEEREAQVMTLFYGSKGVSSGIFDSDSKIVFQQEFQDGRQVPFISLKDLNNTFIVARVAASQLNEVSYYKLYFDLNTEIGVQSLYFDFPLRSEKQILNTAPVRYIGLYIPEGYFK